MQLPRFERRWSPTWLRARALSQPECDQCHLARTRVLGSRDAQATNVFARQWLALHQWHWSRTAWAARTAPKSIVAGRMPFLWHILPMKAAMDTAGRVVIPKALRSALGFKPGQILEARAADGRLELEIAATPMKLTKQGKGMVAAPK